VKAGRIESRKLLQRAHVFPALMQGIAEIALRAEADAGPLLIAFSAGNPAPELAGLDNENTERRNDDRNVRPGR